MRPGGRGFACLGKNKKGMESIDQDLLIYGLNDVREYWVRLYQIVSFDMILPSVCFNSFNI
ncbi:hypothetical protein EFR63_08030 [Lactobacillus delbrueckii subsp. lactis]|nr:hypothetical protein [Lactobacillus delbrueckii subsp. lactis]